MKIGDHVRLIGIPDGVRDIDGMNTCGLFQECLNKVFTVTNVGFVTGVSHPFATLDVGHVVGQAPYMHTIWVEEQFLEVQPD